MFRGGSVWSEWSSAIPPLEGVVNDPCSDVAVSGRNGQVQSPLEGVVNDHVPRWQRPVGMGRVRGRWRSQRREMPKVYRQRWHVGSFLSGQKRTTGSQLTAWR
jgi:hypothetical protein